LTVDRAAGTLTVGTARTPDTIERAARFLFYAGCIGIPLLVLRLPGGVTVSDTLFGLSAVLLVVSRHRRPVPANGTWRLASALTILATATVVGRADSATGTIETGARLLFLFLTWQWQARVLLDTEVRVRRAIWMYVIGGTVSGGAAIAEAKLGLFAQYTFSGRSEGLTAQPNDAGATLSLALVFALGLLLTDDRVRQRWAAIAALVVGVGLFLSGSITGMIAAAAGLIVFPIRLRLRPSIYVKVAAVLLLVYFAAGGLQDKLNSQGLSVGPLSRLKTALGHGASTSPSTLTARLHTDSSAWHGIAKSPLIGHGLDQASIIVFDGYAAHNMLLLAWYGGGLLLLAAVILAGTTGLAAGWRRVPGDRTREVAFAAAVSALAFSMSGPVLYDRFFWFAYVLLLANRDRIDQPDRKSRVGVWDRVTALRPRGTSSPDASRLSRGQVGDPRDSRTGLCDESRPSPSLFAPWNWWAASDGRGPLSLP
jgi:hypothetical protein